MVYSVENHWPAADAPSPCTRPAASAPLSMGSTVDKPSLDVLAAWQLVSTWARSFAPSMALIYEVLGHLGSATWRRQKHCLSNARTMYAAMSYWPRSVPRHRFYTASKVTPLYLPFHSNPLQPSSASNFGADCPLLANARLDAS